MAASFHKWNHATRYYVGMVGAVERKEALVIFDGWATNVEQLALKFKFKGIRVFGYLATALCICVEYHNFFLLTYNCVGLVWRFLRQ